MRGLLGLVIGIGMAAFAVGYIPMDDTPPRAIRFIMALFGFILIWASLYHMRLRAKRRAAYNGGMEKRGTAQLYKPIGGDDATAKVVFRTSFAEWLISLDLLSLKDTLQTPEDEALASAWLGDDGCIYALDIAGVKTLPLSPGKPVTKKSSDAMNHRTALREHMAAKRAERKIS